MFSSFSFSVMAAKQPIISAEDLKDVLECPVCLKVPRSAPVFQCERGHVVCHECHPKLVTCPVCRLPLGNTRSLISEKVLARYVIQNENMEGLVGIFFIYT